MNKINMKHWLEGGTALTNFRKEEEQKYLDAIATHGDPAYVVVHAPMDKHGSVEHDYSLHYLNVQEGRDASPFWYTYWKLNPIKQH